MYKHNEVSSWKWLKLEVYFFLCCRLIERGENIGHTGKNVIDISSCNESTGKW